MKRKISLLLGICIILYSCNSNKISNRIVSFEHNFKIKGEAVPLDSFIFFPKKMLWFDDSTIVVSEIRDEYGIKVIRIRNQKAHVLQKIVRRGNGPNEVIFNANIIQKDVKDLQKGIWINDIRWSQFHPYGEDGKFSEEFSHKFYFPKNLLPVNSSFIINDSIILGNTSSISEQIFTYNSISEELQTFNLHPKIDQSFSLQDSKTVFNFDMDIRGDKKFIVMAYGLYKILNVVQTDDIAQTIQIQFKDGVNTRILTQDRVLQLNNIPIQYIKTYSTNDYIYALYANKITKELGIPSENEKKLQIHVFRWDGEPCCIINIDQWINCFCVDDSNSIIYGFNPEKESNSELFLFPISGIFEKIS